MPLAMDVCGTVRRGHVPRFAGLLSFDSSICDDVAAFVFALSLSLYCVHVLTLDARNRAWQCSPTFCRLTSR